MMGESPYAIVVFLVALVVGRGYSQNPDGDSLVCSESIGWYYTIGCLGASLSDQNPGVDGRPHKAGEVYRTYCTKNPEETWVLNNDGGVQTLRLKSDPSQCLTIDNNLDPTRMAPCDPTNPAQKMDLRPITGRSQDPDFHYFEIVGGAVNQRLIYELKHNIITKKANQILANTWVGPYRYFCEYWVWASEIEAKATPNRATAFSFPIKEPTNPLRMQYLYSFWEQMMHRTAPYPDVYVTNKKWGDTCDRCASFPCDCFPMDYSLTQSPVTTVVTMDPTLKTSVGFELYEAMNRVPAGIFAKPWSTLEFQVGNYDTSKVTIRARLYLHDDLITQDTWWRPPVIEVDEVLQPGYNRIRSPYGGPLTIELFGRDPTAAPINITISGGIPMATFILGKTTEADWPSEVAKEPHRIIIQGEHAVGYDLKAPYAKATFQQMVAMVKRYDLMIKNGYLISGYDLNPTNREDIHAAPQGWYYWARDASGKNPHAGNPIVYPNWHDGDVNLSLDSWSIWLFGHEFGHNMQTKCYSLLYGTDTTNNVYSAFHVAYFCGNGKQTPDCATNKGQDYEALYNEFTLPNIGKKTYPELVELSPWAPLSFWIQIVTTYGYESFRNLNRRMREKKLDPNDPTCTGDDAGKYDAVYEILCNTTGVDLTSHFDTYRVTLSTAVRDRVIAKSYPKPTVDISSIILKPGMSLTWATSPSYALPPYKSIQDAQ